jgi:hypothetical protein
MKCAVVSALISIAFVSQAFAVLRPLVPAKPAPPFNGELIIIGGDSVTAIQIVRPVELIAETQPQFYLGLRRFSMMIFQCIAADECRCFFFSTDDGDNSIPSAIASLTVPFSRCLTLSDHGASFGFSANVSARMRANHGANPKGSKEGRRINDAQTLVLIHTVVWPILIWLLSKTWSYA